MGESVTGYRACINLLLLCGCILGFFVLGARAQKPEGRASEYETNGSLALEQRNYTAAARDFRSALKLDPSSAAAHSGLGIALRESGHLSEAVSEFQQAAKLEPNGWEPRYLLAQTFILLGDFKNAIGELRRVLQLRVDYPDALYNLAMAERSAGDRSAATGIFES
jgi:Flp pilus assembly protein TadD